MPENETPKSELPEVVAPKEDTVGNEVLEGEMGEKRLVFTDAEPELEIARELVREIESGLLVMTDAGRAHIQDWVTDLEAQVYAFTTEADPIMVAASQARLSRSANQLLTILLKEFISTTNPEKYQQLLNRVVNTFGDDSVMQLAFLQVVFEGVSNIATKFLEDGRLAGYLETSTRYLRMDQKDENGNYRYLVPDELDPETKTEFKGKIDEVFDIYSELYQRVKQHIMDTSTEEVRDADWERACHTQACDTIRSLLPVATKATVGMSGSMQSMYNLLLRLEAERLPELKKLHAGLLKAARAVAPVFFQRVDNPERGGLISRNKENSNYDSRELAGNLAEKYEVNQKYDKYVELLGVDGSEDEVLAKILADHSEFPLSEWMRILEQATDAEKTEIIDTYVGERDNRRVKPGRAYEMPHYLFEVQSDIGAFRDVHRSRMVDGFTWQRFQPYLGHTRPQMIDDAGLTDLYERAFEASKEAYELLMERGYEEQAQYAVLFGNNVRYSFKVNARSFIHSAELRTTPQGHPSYREIYQKMAALVTKEHPTLFKVMKFLNKDEDPELARLGAIREQTRRDEAEALAELAAQIEQ